MLGGLTVQRDREPTPAQTALVRSAARRLAYAATVVAGAERQIVVAAQVVADCLAAGGKVLVCGNGGSAASAQHFAAEFTGKLSADRAPLAAIALSTDTSALTAIANDYSYDDVFARQVAALARPGDVVVGLTTSGTSRNVVKAVDAGKRAGATTVSLTGPRDQTGAEISLTAAVRETARVQEIHDLMLHEVAQLAERLVIEDIADDASADPFDFLLDEDALEAFQGWMARTGQSLSTTNGVFDLLHAGHRSSLQQARALGDRLVVLVNSDASVRRLKGPARPIRSQADRISDLMAEPAVDHVVLMPDDRPDRLLGVLRPAVHAKGSEYAQTGVPEAAVVESFGGRVAYLERVEGYSTTAQLARAEGR
jgi:rfaE bifunctional protein nucleotidyltransferase chain/domain